MAIYAQNGKLASTMYDHACRKYIYVHMHAGGKQNILGVALKEW